MVAIFAENFSFDLCNTMMVLLKLHTKTKREKKGSFQLLKIQPVPAYFLLYSCWEFSSYIYIPTHKHERERERERERDEVQQLIANFVFSFPGNAVHQWIRLFIFVI